MDTVGWIGLAGILGTLVAPLLSERMRRESVRRERIDAQQLDVYADLLKATARLVDNAMTWSADPLAKLKQTDDEQLDRIISRARILASDKVFAHLTHFTGTVHKFNRLLEVIARPAHQQARDEGKADNITAIQARSQLAGFADELRALHTQLEGTIRAEIKA